MTQMQMYIDMALNELNKKRIMYFYQYFLKMHDLFGWVSRDYQSQRTQDVAIWNNNQEMKKEIVNKTLHIAKLNQGLQNINEKLQTI